MYDSLVTAPPATIADERQSVALASDGQIGALEDGAKGAPHDDLVDGGGDAVGEVRPHGEGGAGGARGDDDDRRKVRIEVEDVRVRTLLDGRARRVGNGPGSLSSA